MENITVRRKVQAVLLTFAMVFSIIAGVHTGGAEETFAATKLSQYSLKGAKYQLYTNSGCTTKAKDSKGNDAVLTTGANGESSTLEMEPGNYWAKEIQASPGYLLDPNAYPLEITSDHSESSPLSFTSKEVPTVGKPLELLSKEDKKGKNGWRKLLGAEYTLRYYDVDPSTTNISGLTPTREWVFETVEKKNDKGRSYAGIDFINDDPIRGDEFYTAKVRATEYDDEGTAIIDARSTTVRRVLPIGVFTIEETKSPKGLARNLNVYVGNVKQPSSGAHAVTSLPDAEDGTLKVDLNDETINFENPASAVIKIKKKPAQENAKLSSKASLAGAEYEVYYNDPELANPELVGKITTDENGDGELTEREMGTPTLIGTPLELGEYYIKEVKASPGFVIDKYVLNEGTQEIREGSIEVTVKYDSNGSPQTKTITGSFEDGQHLFKARAEDPEANPFEYTVTSLETATETHIKKTDATTTKELPGATLQIFDSEGEILEEWVSTEEEHIVYGLPAGEYTLREITAPYGYDIAEDIKFTVEDGKIVTKVEMKNKPLEIGTVATDAENGTHQGMFKEDEVINDLVKLSGLTVGREYQVKGKLVDKATGEVLKDKDGNDVVGECEPFTATSENMEVTITFHVDSSKFDKDFAAVAFEKLFRTSAIATPEGTPERPEEPDLPKEIGGHEDPDDPEQIINYGGIVKTIATDKNEIVHNVMAGEDTVIVDTVEYKNLSTKETYTLEGQLYDKTTDELLDVTASKTFTPKKSDGTEKMTFKFDATGLENHVLVVFEKLLVNGKEVDKHEDPEDEDQTIWVPEIATKIGTPKGNKVVDTVAYKNLIPGQEYIMRGWLINKATGEKVKGSDGYTKFVPDEPNGRVEVTLKLKGASGSLVAFEECYAVDGETETKVAEHKDPDDPDQTITRKPRPKTGEDYMIFLLGGAFVSAAALAVVLKRRGALKK